MANNFKKVREATDLVVALLVFWISTEYLAPLRLFGAAPSILDQIVGLVLAVVASLFVYGRPTVRVIWKITGEEVTAKVYHADLRSVPRINFILDARVETETLVGWWVIRSALRRGARAELMMRPESAVRLIDQGGTGGASICQSDGRIFIPLDVSSGMQRARVSGTLTDGGYADVRHDLAEIQGELRRSGESKAWWWVKVESSVESVRVRSSA